VFTSQALEFNGAPGQHSNQRTSTLSWGIWTDAHEIGCILLSLEAPLYEGLSASGFARGSRSFGMVWHTKRNYRLQAQAMLRSDGHGLERDFTYWWGVFKLTLGMSLPSFIRFRACTLRTAPKPWWLGEKGSPRPSLYKEAPP